MRIVIVTPAVPHPFGDTAARWYYVLITELAARGHEIAALAVSQDSSARAAEAEQWMAGRANLRFRNHRLQTDSNVFRRKWRSLLRPDSILLQDRDFTALLQGELAKGYDVLHLEQMTAAWLGIGLPRTLVVVHYLDVLDQPLHPRSGLAERKRYWQGQRAVSRLLRSISHFSFLTPRLEETARTMYADGDYRVVPMALDTSLYEIQPFVEEPVVGLIGSMHWEPSRSAGQRLLQRIWPLVKEKIPRARLLIAGWHAARYLGGFLPAPDVTLEENLAHPREFFSRVAVMAYAPRCGSGMKVKIMESMAYGVPVVTTWEGMEGMEYENGKHCWVAETDEEFAAHICRLLKQPVERAAMRIAGRQLIEDSYSPGPVLDKLMAVYQEIVGRNDHGAAGIPAARLTTLR
jgi:glycosyltransferase involved in cell wall biosynthesis